MAGDFELTTRPEDSFTARAVAELADLAAESDRALISLQDGAIQQGLNDLNRICEQVARAWSGSNIGYHARTYWTKLQPKDPGAIFSAEWGLGDNWPIYSSAPEWEIMDENAVINEIVSRSGWNDPKALDARIGPLRAVFQSVRESILSVLSAALNRTTDPFLQKKLEEIERLTVYDPHSVARRMLPQGSYWSRDTLALTEGLRVAPHQSVLALVKSAQGTAAALEHLGKTARLCGSHLQRIRQQQLQQLGRGRRGAWPRSQPMRF